MVAEVMSGLSAFSTMFGIAKSMKDMNDAVIRNQAVYDLTEQILAAQEKYAATIERVHELEKQVAAFENWDAESKRYELRDYGAGTFAFEFRISPTGREPPHRICPACYENRKKGLLQSRGKDAWAREMVKCAGCDKEFVLGARVERDLSARGRSSYSPRGGSDFDVFSGR